MNWQFNSLVWDLLPITQVYYEKMYCRLVKQKAIQVICFQLKIYTHPCDYKTKPLNQQQTNNLPRTITA